jgi:hypothetical protein
MFRTFTQGTKILPALRNKNKRGGRMKKRDDTSTSLNI